MDTKELYPCHDNGNGERFRAYYTDENGNLTVRFITNRNLWVQWFKGYGWRIVNKTLKLTRPVVKSMQMDLKHQKLNGEDGRLGEWSSSIG
jgi:hypothetical protein